MSESEMVEVTVFTPDHVERTLRVKSPGGVVRCVEKLWIDYIQTLPEGRDAIARATNCDAMVFFTAPQFRAYPLPPDSSEPRTELFLTPGMNDQMFAVGSSPYRFLLAPDPERMTTVGVQRSA